MSDSVLPALLDMGIPHPLASAAAARYSSVDAAVNWCFGDGQNWTPESSSPAWPSPVLSPLTSDPLPDRTRSSSPSRPNQGLSSAPARLALPAPPVREHAGSGSTKDDDEELRKALELSLQDHGGHVQSEETRRDEGRVVGPLNRDQAEAPVLPARPAQTTAGRPATPGANLGASGGEAEDEDAQLSRAIQDSLMTASMHSLRSMAGSRVTLDGQGEEGPTTRERAEGQPLAFYSSSGDHAPTALLLQALFAVPQIREAILAGIGEGGEDEGIDQRARILRDQAELLRSKRAAVNVDGPAAPRHVMGNKREEGEGVGGEMEEEDEMLEKQAREKGVAEGLMGGWKVGAWPVVGSTRSVLESVIDTIKTDLRRLGAAGKDGDAIQHSSRLFGTLPSQPVMLQPPTFVSPAMSTPHLNSFRPPETAGTVATPSAQRREPNADHDQDTLMTPSESEEHDPSVAGPSVNTPENAVDPFSVPTSTSLSNTQQPPEGQAVTREKDRINYLILSRSSTLGLAPRLHPYLGLSIWGDEKDGPAEGWQRGSRGPESLEEVGEVMCVLVGREGGSDTGAGGIKDGSKGWEIEEGITMDRYMSRNVVLADKVRAEQRTAKQYVERESEVLEQMTMHKGENVLESLRTLLEHYDKPVVSGLALGDQAGTEGKAEMRDEVRSELQTKLKRISAALETKVAEKKAEIDKAKGFADGHGFETDEPDMNQEKYELCAVLMHDGITLPGSHLYAYVREEGRWWKVRDGHVDQADIEAIKGDKTGVYMDGGVYMLVYARVSPRAPTPPSSLGLWTDTPSAHDPKLSRADKKDSDLIDLDTPREGSPETTSPPAPASQAEETQSSVSEQYGAAAPLSAGDDIKMDQT